MNKHWDRDARTDGSVDQSQAQMQALAQQQAALIGQGKGKAYRVHRSQALIRALCYKRCTSQKSNYHHKLKGTKSQIYTVEGQKGEQQNRQ